MPLGGQPSGEAGIPVPFRGREERPGQLDPHVRSPSLCISPRTHGRIGHRHCRAAHVETPFTAAAAGSAPCARCSSRRAHRAAPGAAHHRARAAPDGRPQARPVAPGAARGASPDRSNRGPRRAPRPSASPAVATPMSAAPRGRVCYGSGSRSPGDRSGRSAARSSWASRKRWRGARSPDRHRPGSGPSTTVRP